MVLYEDFTYYSRFHFENAVNIGWCDRVDEVIEENYYCKFMENLWKYLKQPLNVIRSESDKEVEFNGEKLIVGYSEIRVLDIEKSIKYAAPDMIFLRILEGTYIPSKEFINAVIEGPKPGSYLYQEYMNRYNEEFYWGEDDEYIGKVKMIQNLIINRDLSAVYEIIEEDISNSELVTSSGSLLNLSLMINAMDLSFYLLEKGVDINKFSGRELNTAIENGQNEIVKYLLSKNIMVNMSSSETNPYFKAILNKNIEAVSLLIESGIDHSKRYTNAFMKDFAPIDLARKYKQTKIIELLSCRR